MFSINERKLLEELHRHDLNGSGHYGFWVEPNEEIIKALFNLESFNTGHLLDYYVKIYLTKDEMLVCSPSYINKYIFSIYGDPMNAFNQNLVKFFTAQEFKETFKDTVLTEITKNYHV